MAGKVDPSALPEHVTKATRSASSGTSKQEKEEQSPLFVSGTINMSGSNEEDQSSGNAGSIETLPFLTGNLPPARGTVDLNTWFGNLSFYKYHFLCPL